MRKKTVTFFLLCLTALISAAWAENPDQTLRTTSFSEEDFDRILIASRTADGISAGDFFLFKGFSEEMKLKCEPLVGPKQWREIRESQLLRTRFYRDVGELDLALGFALELAQTPTPQNSIHYRLLKIYGFSATVTPYEAHAETVKKLRQEFRNYQTKRTSRAAKEDPDFAEECFQTFSEKAETIGGEYKTMMEQLVSADHGLLIAIALQQNMIQNLRLLPRKDPQTEKLLDRYFVDEFDNLLLNECKNAFGNSRYIPEFRKLFPDARGVWSGMPPVNRREMADLWRKSIQTFQKRTEYSAKGEFEAWGNCCLSIFWLVQDWKCASPLRKQFHDALTAYQQDFL